jgi:hypothetical protein
MPLTTEFLSDRAEDFRIDVRERAIEEGFGGSIGHGLAPSLECGQGISLPPMRGQYEERHLLG